MKVPGSSGGESVDGSSDPTRRGHLLRDPRRPRLLLRRRDRGGHDDGRRRRLYRIDPAGALHLEAKIDGQPNGVDLMPGEHTLVLAATTANRLTTFTVGADGALSAEAPFAAVDAPDGLAVDAGGNVYVAATVSGKGAIVVIDSKGQTLGDWLGTPASRCSLQPLRASGVCQRSDSGRYASALPFADRYLSRKSLAQRPCCVGMGPVGFRNGAAHHDEAVHHAPVNFQVHRHTARAQSVCVKHAFVHQRVALGQAEPGWGHALHLGHGQR